MWLQKRLFSILSSYNGCYKIDKDRDRSQPSKRKRHTLPDLDDMEEITPEEGSDSVDSEIESDIN